MSDRLALSNAIEDAGIERGKAQRLASVIFDAIHDNVATKADVQASEAAVRGELRAETAAIRGELAQTRTELKADIAAVRADLKARPNAIMLRLGTLMVVLTGIILAALRYFPPPHG